MKQLLLKPIKKTLFFFSFIVLFSSLSFGQNVGKGTYIENQYLQHSSGNRQYSIYIPANYDSTNPLPLVLLFHGFLNRIDNIYQDAQMEAVADANNFIFAIPQGLGITPGWSIGLAFGGRSDDLNFTNVLIDSITKKYNVNAKRVYAAGFSNGGFFSYRLACELSNKIAAIASVAGSMNPSWIYGNNPSCNPQHQMPILQITGTFDVVIPIRGGSGGLPLSSVFNYWKNFNKTEVNPVVKKINFFTEQSTYENGTNGAVVSFIKIVGRGHEWPKTKWAGLRENASIRIWDFFSKYDIDGKIEQLSIPTLTTPGITIYPNPTTDRVTVNNINFSIEEPYKIAASTGQMMLSGFITNANYEIDLTTLPSGLYFLNIGSDVFKILKTK